MDSYSHLLERIRVPQPSIQRFAVISIFEKLISDGPESDAAKGAISYCLRSSSSAVLDQSVRELCRTAKDANIRVSHALLELQAALEGCEDSRSLDLFVKGIGFLCRLGFRNDPSWQFESPEAHPFVKVLSTQTEAQGELLHQMLLFIVQNKTIGFAKTLKFLQPFLTFSVLKIPFSISSSAFARQLISSLAALSCSFPSEAVPIIKVAMGCLKYFPHMNVEAFVVILKQLVSTGLPANELQLCSVELLNTVLSLCADLHKRYPRSEQVIELSKRLLFVQKELGLRYIPDFISVATSLFIILIQAEFEHEQLSILKLSLFLLKWKNENEYVFGRATCSFNEEFIFIFPIINLLASPSMSVKAAAIDFLSLLERLFANISVAPKKVLTAPVWTSSTSRPEYIIFRLILHLWFQDRSSLSNLYFLKLACIGKSESIEIFGEAKSWISELREYSLMTAVRQKPAAILQSLENLLTGMPSLLCALVATLVIHPTMGRSAVDSLASLGMMDPKVGVPLLLSILFYNKVFCNGDSKSHDLLLKLLGMLPSLASQSVMVPLVVQTILPMLHKDARQLLYATAVRLLCKTWEVTDRVFGNLQGILQPAAFSEFVSEKNICISMAASVRDVCKGNPDRGVDLILSVSACIESRDPIVQALGFESLGHLCEADVVDFYTAWDVIAKHVLDYSVQPTVARGLCILLRWGALDAEAYPDAPKRVVQILWEIGNFRHTGNGEKWIRARASAFASLIHYEVELLRESISDFNKRNMELLCSEDNLEVLRSIESLEAKILSYEHITRRRLLKEKRVAANKVEKLLDVFPQVMFSSGKYNVARELPGASLLSLAFNPKDARGQQSSKEFVKLQAAYESTLKEIAGSLPLSRNILVALLSLQSWKPFMQRWMKASVLSVDAKITPNESDKALKASDDILKSLCHIAEESIPRSAENIALAIGALCEALPPSAHAVTSTASKFLLKWLFQYEHEHRQWSSAISLGMVSSCLHATESQLKLQIITGLLEVSSNSKSTLVKGACGLGMGFSCQDLLTKGGVGDSDMEEGTAGSREATLLGNIIKAFSSMISQLCPSSSHSLQSLCENFSCTGDLPFQETMDLSGDNLEKMEEDIWGVAALVLGLAYSVIAVYRAGDRDAVLMIKDMLLSWIPHVNLFVHNPSVYNERPEMALSVGSCLALPTVVAFCQRAELMGDELDNLVNGYKSLISELVKLKKSGLLHQSLLMASCIGAGNLLSCILNEGVHPVKADDVEGLLELMRNTYCQPYPPPVNLGGMLGIVNALGAGAGTLTPYCQCSSLQMDCAQKESHYIRGPILANPLCEPLCTSLMQELFVVAQDSNNQQMQRYAAWAVSFLRHRWWSKDFQSVDVSNSNPVQSKSVSQNIAEDGTAWQLCSWLMDLNYLEVNRVTHVITVAAVLRCLSHAPRLPSLDWGAIIRRCMKYEDQISSKLKTDLTVQKGMLREECIHFSLAHANKVTPLLFFLDELSDLSRFRMLELNLQSCLLSHLADMMKIFSGSRVEKLFSDMLGHFFSPASSYHSYNPEQKSVLQISFWKGLRQALDEAATGFPEYVANMEKCMEELFLLLPAFLHVDDGVEQAKFENEWCEVVRCLEKAPKDWLMDFLQLPENSSVGRSHLIESVKRISARARLVMIGCLPVTELGKTKHYILNTESDGIWNVLIEVVAALQHTEGHIKRQWLLDAVEISCISKYPSTALQLIGLLSGSFCKYMPLLIVDQVTVLSDLPVTLPSLLSNSGWNSIAESLVLNLLASTERIYAWAMLLENNDYFLGPESIDRSESCRSVLLARVMLNTCVSLKDYLPFEKQLRLANMVIP